MKKEKRATPQEPNRCVAWLRRALEFTQYQLGTLIGSRQPTIQSIETGRLPLSEHFAFAMERKTGISHQWLLNNDLDAPPVTPAGKPWSRGQANIFAYGTLADFTGEKADFFDQMQLMQTYVLLRGILEELGDKGARATGFNTKLHKVSLNLLATITDKKVRDRVHTEAMKLKLSFSPEEKLQNEKKLKLMVRDIKELIASSRVIFEEVQALPIDGDPPLQPPRASGSAGKRTRKAQSPRGGRIDGNAKTATLTTA